jgi:ubiquinone/menaquinone biosynthesis C-methylase UbiE
MKTLLMRAFGRPQGILGRVGGAIMARSNREIASQVVERLDVKPGDRVLEVDFGPGIAIQLIAAKISSGKVTGIDCSEEMKSHATARNAAAMSSGKVELRLGSVEALRFNSDTFDKALAINSMQVWPDAVAGLREILRVLKPGGIIALGFTPYSGQAKQGLTTALTAAGFAGPCMLDIDRNFAALAVKQ